MAFIDTTRQYGTFKFRFLATTIPECDWRALVVSFLFQEICNFPATARTDERRLVFATRKLSLEETRNQIFDFYRDD